MKKIFVLALLGLCVGLSGGYLINENFNGWTERSSTGNYEQHTDYGMFKLGNCRVRTKTSNSTSTSNRFVSLMEPESCIELPDLNAKASSVRLVFNNGGNQAVSLQVEQNQEWKEIKRIVAPTVAAVKDVIVNIPGGSKLRIVNCSADTNNKPVYLYSIMICPHIAIQGTTIGSTSFTAQWDAVGTSVYQLDVYKKVPGMRYEIMDFEGYTGTFPPDGWLAGRAGVISYRPSYTHEGVYCSLISTGDQWLRTPRLSDPATLSFYAKAGAIDNSAKPELVLQYSADGTSWEKIQSWTSAGQETNQLSTAYQLFSVDLIEVPDDTYLRWTVFGSGGCYLDYVTIAYPDTEREPVSSHEVLDSTSITITGLERNTDYCYLIQATDSAGASFVSEEVQVKTWAYDFPNEQQVTCEEAITISFSAGSANLSDAAPSSAPYESFMPAFTRVLELQGSGPWTIDINAPVESYPWFVYRYGESWNAMENINGSLSINIDSIRNNILEIQAGEGIDDTLPVMLSSFTASINPFNHIALNWISHSEQNLLGYYIYRSPKQYLDDAQKISPMIPACNSSQAQQYHFADPEALSAGMYHYWLQSCELDGVNQFHGPVTIEMPDINPSSTPPLPYENGFSAIFPNPFSSSTEIGYQLKSSQNVQLKIYNAKGQLLRQISENSKAAGFHKTIWDGKTDAGKQCASGVYLIVMKAGSQSYSRKLFLQK